MKTRIRHFMLAALLGSVFSAHAGVLTYQGVSFSSSWSGKVLTLEIDAATHTGDWTKAKGLAALELDGIGNYSAVSVASAPGGTGAWATSSSELTAQGCSGGTNGQVGSRLCFFGQQIALADNMVFSFTFAGDDIRQVDPHVKVEFVNAKGKKVGSLLSQTLPASPGSGGQSGGGATAPATPTTGSPTPTVPATPGTPGTTAGTTPSTPTIPVSTTPPLPAVPSAPAGDTTAGGGSTIVDVPVKDIPPTASLPTTIPSTVPTNIDLGGTAGGGKAQVPEPQSIALLLGGMGLMGLALRRKPRN